MPRRRRQYTEHLGLNVSVQERQVFEAYLKARRMKATEYFREVAIQPLMQVQAEVQDGPDAAA